MSFRKIYLVGITPVPSVTSVLVFIDPNRFLGLFHQKKKKKTIDKDVSL